MRDFLYITALLCAITGLIISLWTICDELQGKEKNMVDRCVICGEPVPEGTQVCPVCIERTVGKPSDMVEVVRCKDCKHLYFKDFSAYCPHRTIACTPNGFCNYGERREGNA